MDAKMFTGGLLSLCIIWGCGSGAESEVSMAAPSAQKTGISMPMASAQDDVTATDVVDRESLRAFVRASKRFYLEEVQSSSRDTATQMLRSEDGPWKTNEIYVFIVNRNGVMLMHGADSTRDGENMYDLEDANGVMMVRELIAAANDNGGYVEYLFDNPAIEGDEEIGSPKVGYAELMDGSGLDGDSTVIIGAGYYN